MKKIYYITFSSIPSALPSSLQIIKTCESLSRQGYNVTLIKPGTGDKKISIRKYYDLKETINIKEFISIRQFPQGLSFYLYSFYCLFLILKEKKSISITRNYFLCFLLLLFKRKTILEIHHDTNLEGRITKFILRYFNFFNKKKLIKIISITQSVKELFIKKYFVRAQKIQVLPSGSSIKINFLPKQNFNKRLKIGYFGSFSSSKGVNTLMRLSKIDPQNDYFIYGVNKEDLSKIKKTNYNKNLFLRQNIPYKDIPKKMIEMDILTLPYTKIVKSAGNVDDISKFTSPLKLFDYLAVGKLIISSNLPVFKEVINSRNAFFVKNFENIYEWKKNIVFAKNNRQKTLIIARNNYELSKKYNHLKRVTSYLNF